MSNKKLAVAALTGLLSVGTLSACSTDYFGGAESSSESVAEKHGCKGQNSCKGKGGCKTDKNACKGHNACKGQGGCATNK